ncbi:hypothetical protein CapIbe_017817 [Capra ibex]
MIKQTCEIDLSNPTRDRIYTPALEGNILTTRYPGIWVLNGNAKAVYSFPATSMPSEILNWLHVILAARGDPECLSGFSRAIPDAESSWKIYFM